MKKLLFLSIILLSLASCKKKDYVTLEVDIKGLEASDSTLTIYGNMFQKPIKADKNGIFKDTLKILEAGYFGLVIGDKVQAQTFLRNGFDLKVTGDAKDINNTIKFKGYGSQNLNYLAKRSNELRSFGDTQGDLFNADSVTFNKTIKDFETKMTKLLADVKKADTTMVRFEKQGLEGYVKTLNETYKRNQEINAKFAKGNPSPKFVNYENYKGGKTSLDDLKGKFAYILIWFTGEKTSVDELTALKQLETEYAGKNIQFVGISVDQKSDYEKWKTTVKEKQLTGIQLNNGGDFAFINEYNITSVPKLILLDPNGNIVQANAPKPSEKVAIKKLFTEAGVQ